MKSWRGKLCRFIPAAFVLIEGMVSKWFILVEKVYLVCDGYTIANGSPTSFGPFKMPFNLLSICQTIAQITCFQNRLLKARHDFFHMLKTKGKTRSVKL
jgi:hypothetical protein